MLVSLEDTGSEVSKEVIFNLHKPVRVSYAGINRIRFKGISVTSESQPLTQHPQRDNVHILTHEQSKVNYLR